MRDSNERASGTVRSCKMIRTSAGGCQVLLCDPLMCLNLSDAGPLVLNPGYTFSCPGAQAPWAS